MAKVNLGRVVGKSAYEIWLDEGNQGTEQDFLNSLKGQDGADGINGRDGRDGTNGQDGFSPVASVQQTSTGAIVSVTDKNGTTSAELRNGVDGINGTDGKDGADGKDGSDGQDGYTPVRGTDYWTSQDISQIEGHCDNYVDGLIGDLEERVDDLENNQLQGSANGTTIDLQDSASSRVKSIGINGNSVQETTTGKNLLNPYLSNTTTLDVTVTYDENTQEITLNGTCRGDNTTVNFTKSNSLNLQSGKSLYALIKYISGSSNGYLALRAYNSDYSKGQMVVTKEPLTDDIFTYAFYDKDVIFNDFSLRFNNGSTFDNLKIKVMFSTVDAVYEPYTNGASPNPDYPQEIKSSGDNGYIVEKFTNSDNTQLQIYTIPCQQPMRAIGDVKDTFIKVNGVWYERHIIEKGVLGTENYRVSTYYEAPDKPTADSFNTACFGIIIPYTVLNNNFLSNRFIYTGESYWSTDKEGLQLTTTDNRFRMRIAKNKLDGYNNGLTNAQKCRLLSDYLNNNLTEVLCSRVEPLDLPCTQAQITALEAWMKARTYKNITHIYSEDEVPAEVDSTYYKDTQTYLDNIITRLEVLESEV